MKKQIKETNSSSEDDKDNTNLGGNATTVSFTSDKIPPGYRT